MTAETIRRLEAAQARLTEDDAATRTKAHDALKALIAAALEIGNDLDELKEAAKLVNFRAGGMT